MTAALRGPAIALVLLAACGQPARGLRDASQDRPTPGPTRCEAVAVPAGFEVVESFEDPYPDHVGVRLGLRDEDGREIHLFTGIPGEFGEGLPVREPVEISTGEQARLLGRGTVWVLIWETGDACSPVAVLGSPFERAEFLRILEDSGVVAADEA